MWIYIACAAIAALSALVLLNRKNVSAPGPTEYPLIQGLPFLLQHVDHLLESMVKFSKLYGTTWTVKWPFSPRFFFTTNPKNVERILKENFDNYIKGPYFGSNVGDLLGHGIFNSDGAQWNVQRKLATHMFSRREFQDNIITTFRKHGAELERILSDAAQTAQPIDMQSLFFRFTLDSVGDIAFGHTVGALKNPDVPFSRAFDQAQAIVEHRFLRPGWQILEHLDGTRRQLNASIHLMDEYSLQLIQERRQANDYEERRDLLSRFMCAKDEQTGQPVYLHDDKFLRDVIMNFMIAGRDTTAQALSWTVYCLSQHQDVEKQLAEEARTLLGGHDSLKYEDLTYDIVAKSMKYTQAVLQETLRLYPSVPKDVKQAVGDDTLPDGTFIPAGSLVAYLPHAMGRMESNWPNPEAFDPQRFLNGEKHSQYKFIAFNAGYRTCLGMHMALVEASFVLGLIFRKYTLQLVPGQEITYAESLTLPMKNGIRMIVKRRGD